MRLYVFDDRPGSPLMYRTDPLSKDYQADRIVRSFAQGRNGRLPTHFILVDNLGILCVWKRSIEAAFANAMPEIVKVATRCTIECWRYVEPEDLIFATEANEEIALAHHFRK